MNFKVARVGLHHWEEPVISGEKGSGTVFFSGCYLRCVYCQNYAISHKAQGLFISQEQLIKLMLYLQDKGAHNINLVTPSHYITKLPKILKEAKQNGLEIPIGYNTSSYESVENLKSLEGLVDVYLPDLKYYDNALGQRYSKVKDYFDVASEAIIEMLNKSYDVKRIYIGIIAGNHIGKYFWQKLEFSYFRTIEQYIKLKTLAEDFIILKKEIS